MERKKGEQLLRDFAADNARAMRRYARKAQDSSFARDMVAYHRGRFNGYMHALDVINTKCFWRDE